MQQKQGREQGRNRKQEKGANALAISLGVLAISAAIVRIWYVWMVLGIIAAAISYTLIVRVPTQKNEQTERAAERESEPAQ